MENVKELGSEIREELRDLIIKGVGLRIAMLGILRTETKTEEIDQLRGIVQDLDRELWSLWHDLKFVEVLNRAKIETTEGIERIEKVRARIAQTLDSFKIAENKQRAKFAKYEAESDKGEQ